MKSGLVCLLFAFCSLAAWAQDVKKDYLIKISVPVSHEGNEEHRISKVYCEELHKFIALEEKRAIEGDCVFTKKDLKKNESALYKRVISVSKKNKTHEIRAEITDSDTLAEGLDFKWETDERISSVKKILKNFVEYSNEDQLMLSEIAAEQKYDLAYPKGEAKKKKHYVRSILEVSGMLLAGGGIYQLFDFSHDRDFDYNWEGIKGKFSPKGFRFDDNHRMYNFYAHPLVGSIYYTTARSNGMNPAEGFLMAFVASALWEFVAEFPEVSSVNDQFQTAFAGPAIGEAAYQLGEFFRSGGNNPANKILRNIFGWQQSMHNFFDGVKAQRSKNLDEYGMNNDYWHRINIYKKVSSQFNKDEFKGMAVDLGFDMKVNTVKGLLEPGESNRVALDTLFVEMAAQLGIRQDLVHDFQFYAKSVFLGVISKKITEEQKKRGYALIFGPSASYRLFEGPLGDKFDKYALVNLIGSTMDLLVFLDDLKIRISLDVFGNFTSIRSLAVEKYQAANPNEVIRANLANNKYYNAFGLSQTGAVDIEYKNVGTRMSWQYHKAFSIQGLERNQDEITNDFKLEDVRSKADVELYFKVPKYGMKFGVGYELMYGESVIKDNKDGVQKNYVETQYGHMGYMSIGFEW